MRTRLLAGLWHRRGTHLTLAAAICVVAAGAALVTADGGLVAPLLILAAGVVPAAGQSLGGRRRHEAALLRLRGRRGWSLAAALVAEPLVPVLAGGGAGVAVAWSAAPDRWPYALAVVAGAGAVVLVAMLVALREPLPAQLGGRRRSLGDGQASRFVGVLVVVAAVVAVLRRGSDGPGWLPYAGPTLVGLAVGVLAVGLLRVVGRWLAERADLVPVLTGRRLAGPRAADGLPLLVAAGVLLALACNTLFAVQDWEEDTRAVTAGAPLVVRYAGDPDGVLEATREADPDGRWLMAAVRVFPDDRPVSRRAYLDTARYERVVGDALDGTPAEQGSAAVLDLHEAATTAEREPVATGKFLTASVSTDSPRAEFALVSVATDGVEGGARQELFVHLPPGTTTTTYVPLARCDLGCRVLGLEVAVGRPCGDSTWARRRCRRPVVHLTRLNVGGLDLLDREWVVSEPDDRPPGELTADDEGLDVRPSVAGNSVLTTERGGWSAPLLATPSVDWGGEPEAPTTSNLPRPGRVLATVPALPLVGSGGTVLDLPTSTFDGGSFGASAEPWVLARPDTPDEVLAGLGTPATPREISAAVIEDSGSGLARDLLLVALGALLLGVLGVALPAPRLRAERTGEHAALRVVGVDPRVLQRSARLQTCILA
ncbi:hypothetical protein, partial [Nocardioides pelophilus]|uniref:hypothetical protein n=1 Tax=Nocardioides pelophilus TaxID=2172019 RepID=UPI001C814CCD